MEDQTHEYMEWCFTKHIYFYGYELPNGKFMIVQFVAGERKQGTKVFAPSEVDNQILELYKTVYNTNNKAA